MRTLMICGALLGALATTACGGQDSGRRTRAHAAPSSGGDDRVASQDDVDRDVDERSDEAHPERDSVITQRSPAPSVDAPVATTAEDQSERADDLAITRHIRRAVVGHAGLSMSARNIVIVTRGGVVTLRGTVDSPNERVVVTQLARDATGVVRVEDQIAVAN